MTPATQEKVLSHRHRGPTRSCLRDARGALCPGRTSPSFRQDLALRPDTFHPGRIFAVTAVFLLLTVDPGEWLSYPSLAQEFRVENAVYAGYSDRPRAQTTTLFAGGKVYDFLHHPDEIVIFDPIQRRFVLINPTLRICTQLGVEQVAAFINTLRSWASQQEDPFLRFTAAPELTVRPGPTSTSLLFESAPLTYYVEVDRPPDPQIAKRYAEFSDWYSQLNTMVTPGARLPFPRIYVNQVLLQQGFVPLKVELHLKDGTQNGGKPTVIRSHHNFFYRLLEPERARARQADEFARIFRSVGFVEYQQKILQLAKDR